MWNTCQPTKEIEKAVRHFLAGKRWRLWLKGMMNRQIHLEDLQRGRFKKYHYPLSGVFGVTSAISASS
jgi:hypothetical protein